MDIKKTATGSFGIPPQMAEANERAREQADKKRTPIADVAPAPAAPVVEATDDKEAEESDPIKLLEKLGAKFGQEDFQKMLYKGYYETEIPITQSKFGELKATFRTLLGSDYDEVDEILATEIKDIQMTNEGFDTRRHVLQVAYGVTHLDGKLIVKPIMAKDKTLDTRATALARRKILLACSPQVINNLIRCQRAIVGAINLVFNDPSTHLKNS